MGALPALGGADHRARVGGAVRTLRADSMMPDAFADGGKPAGLFTAMGFSLAFFLHTIQ